MKKIIFVLILITMIGCASEHIDDDHDHSVEIEGSDMKTLSVQEVADLWEIDSTELLGAIIKEFDFKREYNTDTILEDMRAEYKFSPAIIKDLAEELKGGSHE